MIGSGGSGESEGIVTYPFGKKESEDAEESDGAEEIRLIRLTPPINAPPETPTKTVWSLPQLAWVLDD